MAAFRARLQAKIVHVVVVVVVVVVRLINAKLVQSGFIYKVKVSTPVSTRR